MPSSSSSSHPKHPLPTIPSTPSKMATSALFPPTTAHRHRPYHPSPLSMRSPNTCALSSSSPTRHSPTTLKSASYPPPPRRHFQPKNTPPNRSVTRDREAESAKRRVDLLKQGRERRERSRWRGREEQILQSDYREQQRRWEEEQVRAMQEVGAWAEDEDAEAVEEDDDGSLVTGPEHGADFDQTMLSQEAELEAMYACWSDTTMRDGGHADDWEDMTTEYGSEDAEYDELLMGFAAEAERGVEGRDRGEDMDMEMEMG